MWQFFLLPVVLQMAQYFEFPVKLPPAEDVIADVIMGRWSEVDPMLAVATRNKKLWVVQEEVRCRSCPGMDTSLHFEQLVGSASLGVGGAVPRSAADARSVLPD